MTTATGKTLAEFMLYDSRYPSTKVERSSVFLQADLNKNESNFIVAFYAIPIVS